MKSPTRRRKSIIFKNKINQGLFNSLENNKKINFKTDEDINYKKYKSENKNKKITEKEIKKNSEIHKRNSLLKKENLKFKYKMEYFVAKKLNYYYNDKCNYFKLIINSILSNNNSKIKQNYIEMLYEIETKDLLSQYILKTDVYYFLKYLLVVYDKFRIQFPTYLKDINVYNFMNKYLLVKQKFIDRASKSNYQTYIEENIKNLFSRHPSQDSKFFQSKISHDISEEENHVKKKRIRDQGFDVDDEDSQDSLEKLENLVTKMNIIPKKKDSEIIFKRARSKSIKNTSSFLAKYFNIEKDKLVNRNYLYKMNRKNPMRSNIKTMTANISNRHKVNFEKIIVNKESKKKIKKKSKNKNIKAKKNEIKEIKKFFLLNDFGKNNKLFNFKKKGILFITEGKRNNNKKNLNSKNKTQNIKLDKIKEKYKTMHKSEKIYNYNHDKHNKDYYLMKKNINFIVRSLNEDLNEYPFNNKIKYNLSGKKKYYNTKITSGIFNNKTNLLLNLRSINSKNTNMDKNRQLLETISSSYKKYNTIDQKPCKKLNKYNNNIYHRKLIKHNLWLSIYNLKKENNDYIHKIITEKNEENPREINNQIERIENSIYNFFKTNSMKNKSLFKYEFNNPHYINKITTKNSNNKIYMKTEPSLGFVDDSKFRNQIPKKKNFILRNSIIMHYNYKGENYKLNKYDNLSMSDKNIKKEIVQNLVNNGKSDKSTLKICFSDNFKGKEKKILFKVL